ncbi:MAG: hypothetical protein JW936_02040 [Sedimentisphaerales bacterium]|nr:hypothetical protein [Sedimentisphaerales bacterium]
MAKAGLLFNQDNTQFFINSTEEQMTVKECRAFIDMFAGTNVSHLFINTGSQRASYRSKVWDSYLSIGEGDLEGTDRAEPDKAWLRNMKALDAKGIDNFTVWIDRSREERISPWLSMRMNDLHTVHEHDNPMNNSFWRDNPQFWRVPDSLDDERFTAVRCMERAFDFAHAEVREHHLAFIREMLERYDADGIELDWMRFGAHFRAGEEAAGREILNDFMREVRGLTREWSARRGHPVGLAARVPSHPVRARECAMDGLTWAREGLVDILVPTPFWFSADFDIPMELWREMLGSAGDDIILAGGVEVTLRVQRVQGDCAYNDLPSVRGQVVSLLDRGADSFYLFNYMANDRKDEFRGPAPAWKREDYHKLLRIDNDLAKMADQARRHIVTFDDTAAPGRPIAHLLPRVLQGSEPAAFRIYTGPVPQAGEVSVRIGLADRPGVNEARLKVRFNGEYCGALEDLGLCDACDPHPVGVAFPRAVRAMQFEVDKGAMKHGYNVVELIQADNVDGQEVVWVEICIQEL